MPNRRKVPRPTTYRFSDDDNALLDDLAEAMTAESGLPCSRADVIRKLVRDDHQRRGLVRLVQESMQKPQ